MNRNRFLKSALSAVVIASIIGIAYVASGQNENTSRVRVLGRNVNPGLARNENSKAPFAHWRNWLDAISERLEALLTLRKELQLTDEQIEQLRALRGYCKEEVKIALQLKKEMVNLVLDPDPNPIAIRRTANKLGEAIGDTAVKASELAQEVREILTPEQLALLQEFIENRQEWIESRLDALQDSSQE